MTNILYKHSTDHIVVLRLPFLVRLEFGNFSLEERGKRRCQDKNLSEQRKNQQKTQPTYRVNTKT